MALLGAGANGKDCLVAQSSSMKPGVVLFTSVLLIFVLLYNL